MTDENSRKKGNHQTDTTEYLRALNISKALHLKQLINEKRVGTSNAQNHSTRAQIKTHTPLTQKHIIPIQSVTHNVRW